MYLEALNQRLASDRLSSILVASNAARDFLSTVRTDRLAGVLLLTDQIESDFLAAIEALGKPAITLVGQPQGQTGTSVACDFAVAGALGGDIARSCGAKRPAFIAGPAASHVSETLLRGFTSQLAELGLPLPQVARGEPTHDGGYQALLELSVGRSAPDFVFCASDLMAIGALESARSVLGRAVPGDISILGFGDIPAASWAGLQISTIRHPLQRIADEAIRAVQARADEPGTTKSFPGQLVVRKTLAFQSSYDQTIA